MKILLLIGLLLCAPIAKSDIAVIVNPENEMGELTLRDVSRFFMGRLKLFPETGQSIILLDQQQDQESYQIFYTEVIRIGLERLKRYRAAYLFSGKGVLPIELSSDTKVKEYVSHHKDAIGYIDAALVDESVKAVYRYP